MHGASLALVIKRERCKSGGTINFLHYSQSEQARWAPDMPGKIDWSSYLFYLPNVKDAPWIGLTACDSGIYGC